MLQIVNFKFCFILWPGNCSCYNLFIIGITSKLYSLIIPVLFQSMPRSYPFTDERVLQFWLYGGQFTSDYIVLSLKIRKFQISDHIIVFISNLLFTKGMSSYPYKL